MRRGVKGQVSCQSSAEFFGIVIAMYHRDHPPPHFHARYGEHEAKVSIETGDITEGSLPRRVRSLVQEWYCVHIDELNNAWERCRLAGCRTR